MRKLLSGGDLLLFVNHGMDGSDDTQHAIELPASATVSDLKHELVQRTRIPFLGQLISIGDQLLEMDGTITLADLGVYSESVLSVEDGTIKALEERNIIIFFAYTNDHKSE